MTLNLSISRSDFRVNDEQMSYFSEKFTFVLAKLLEFHILELKILNFLIQYKFLTCVHFPCYGLLLSTLMPKK